MMSCLIWICTVCPVALFLKSQYDIACIKTCFSAFMAPSGLSSQKVLDMFGLGGGFPNANKISVFSVLL